MTRNEECYRVAAHGVAHCPRRSGCVDLFCQGRIGGDRAGRQAQQRLPDFDLEVGAAQVQGQGRAGLPGEDLFDEGFRASRGFGQRGIGPIFFLV